MTRQRRVRLVTRNVSAAAAIIIATVACHAKGDAVAKAGGSETRPYTPPPVTDTTPQDLSGMHTTLPPAAPDTFTPPKPAKPVSYTAPAVNYPPAPEVLLATVKREQSFSRFCFQEFGQKADPALAGGVAMLVTIAHDAVTEAKVAKSRWSAPDAGAEVNRCLNERAKEAWRLGGASSDSAASTAAVPPGTYVVQLNFRGGGN